MIEELVGRLGDPLVAVPLTLLVLYISWSKTTVQHALPNLPWVGKRLEAFSETRATYRSFTNVRIWLEEGYAKYSKHGKSYIFPDFSGVPEVIVPTEKTRWLLDHPDDVLSASAAHYDQLEGDYSFTDPYILKSVFHEHVVHKSLARRMGPLIMDTWEELGHSIEETWGSTTQWTEIEVMDNMMHVISRVSNRMFVGLPLCRNPAYLKAMGSFANDVIIGMTLLSFVPRVLKPIFGPLFTLPNRYHHRQSAKFTKPLIEQRKSDMERAARDPTFKWEEPNDYISWHLRLAQAENRILEQDSDMLSRFLMPVNFAAIHTTVFTITMTLFDLLSSDSTLGFLAGIKEEVERVYAEEEGVWSAASLARLYRTDSAIRESMRVSGFMTRGVLRKVVGPHGIANDEEGWTARQGVRVGVDIWSVHHDPDIYPDPDKYDAFRFSRPREEFKKTGDDQQDRAEMLKLKGTGIITTGNTFLPFGHGRHACPGRFFVSHELKMLLAYMVLNYEVQHLPARPENKWFGQTVVPPQKATIKVRRKE